MPAVRINKAEFAYNSVRVLKTKTTQVTQRAASAVISHSTTMSELDGGHVIHFPSEPSERLAFRTKNGKVCEILTFAAMPFVT